MNFFQAMILGIIQGFAEFLPISSSGHLVLVQKIFNIQEPGLTLDIILHIATIVPVFIIYKDIIFDLIKKPFQKFTLYICLATMPAVVATLLFGDIIENLFSTGQFLPIGFFITSILLVFIDKINNKKNSFKNLDLKNSFIIGCIQAIAIIPGISRSGSTIFAGIFTGLKKEDAAKFSFLLSIAATVGASVYQLSKIFKQSTTFEQISIFSIILAFVTATLSGYLAINFTLSLISKCKLKYFSIYVFLVGVFIFLDQTYFNIYF